MTNPTPPLESEPTRLVRDAFGPMPTRRTIIARFKLLGIAVGINLLLIAILTIGVRYVR